MPEITMNELSFPKSLTTRSAWIIPHIKDPRWLLCIYLAIYTWFGHVYLSFNRSPDQMLIAIGACVFFDMLYTWVSTRKLLFPLSALISAFGLIILFSSPGSGWLMLFVSWLTITGKYLLTWRGHHLFNPTNLSLVIVLILTSGHAAIAPAYQWGGSWWLPIVIFLLGLVLMWKVNKLPVVLSFWAFFVIGAAIRSVAIDMPLEITLWAQVSGGAFMLFSFFMITDPMTTPATTRGMIIYGFSIGLVDTLFQLNTAVYSVFYALFFVTATRGLYYIIKDIRDNGLHPAKKYSS